MINLSRKSIIERFPWAKEKSLFDKIDTEQDLDFDNMKKWHLNNEQLKLVVMLFEELEAWFEKHNRKIEIDIYYVGELFDRLHIDFSSSTREVYLIIEKYNQFSVDLIEENYEDIF